MKALKIFSFSILIFYTFDAFSEKMSKTSAHSGDLKVLYKFIEYLKNDQKDKAANLIRFPLSRSKPLKPIANKSEFLSNFGQFFNSDIINKLDQGKIDHMTSWRGTMVSNGALWAKNGRVTHINTVTNLQKEEIEAAISQIKSNTFPSSRNYEKIVFACKTRNRVVQVQKLKGKNWRLASWKSINTQEKPMDLIRGDKKSFMPQGSSGGTIYRFQKENQLHEIQVVGVCGKDCNSYYRIFQSNKLILEEPCQD